jgi:BASS family bile acid:Na+ symporter
MKADILTQVVLPLSLFIIMLGMGLSLKLDDFKRVVKVPKAIAIGVFCQLVLLPLVGFSLVVAFSLPPELAVGVMILAFCPGGTTSNMFAYFAKADVALSISLTAVISLVTPFTIPLLTGLSMAFFMDHANEFSIPIGKTIIQLLVITIVPVALGMFLYRKFPNFAVKMNKPVKVFSIILLFLIIAAIVAKSWDAMGGFFAQTGLVTLALIVSSMIVGYAVASWAKLEKRQVVTIGIEVGIQNGTMALLVAGTILGNATMAIPAVTYSLLMFATGGLFCLLVNRKKHA